MITFYDHQASQKHESFTAFLAAWCENPLAPGTYRGCPWNALNVPVGFELARDKRGTHAAVTVFLPRKALVKRVSFEIMNETEEIWFRASLEHAASLYQSALNQILRYARDGIYDDDEGAELYYW